MKTTTNLLSPLLILTLLTSLISTAPIRRSQRLYDFTDAVELLNTINFKEKVFNSTHPWLIEFYASWCGDCQRFAPLWKNFAIDVYPWQNLVHIGVLECSDEDNVEICREFGIVRYPTVRYFHENMTYGLGEFFSDDDHDKNKEPKKHLLQVIERELNSSRGALYPDIRPYTSGDFTELFTQNKNATFAFLYINRGNISVAQEVAMDLNKNDIIIRGAFTTNTELVSKLKVNKFPALVLIKPDDDIDSVKIITENVVSRSELRNQIKNVLAKDNQNPVTFNSFQVKTINKTDDELQAEKARAGLRRRINKMGDVVFQADLEAAVRYSLKQEVATTKTITGEKLDALRAYINVLQKYLPLGINKDAQFFDKLQQLVEKDQVEGSDIGNLVRDVDNNSSKVFSSSQRFVGCQGSSPIYRNYPCSMWKMFHFLSVNSVLNNVNNRRANPREVLDAMHGYIKNFFSCTACSKHFQQMAERRAIQSVKTLEESILWLWAAHNEVNNRLSGDATEDPEFPKMQFPNKLRCPQCQNANGQWNEAEVLKYLKTMYNSNNVRYVASDTYALFEGL